MANTEKVFNEEEINAELNGVLAIGIMSADGYVENTKQAGGSLH